MVCITHKQLWKTIMTIAIAQKHNYFLAAIPDASLARQMEIAWQRHGTGERFRAQKLHMTLLEFKDQQNIPTDLERLKRCVAGSDLRGFDLVLDRLMTFGGDALVLGMNGKSASASMLNKQLQKALTRSGFQPASSSVTPHVTLAYGPGFPETRLLEKPISWRIDQLTLVDSLVGQGQHIRLADWPLP
jgi:2'-5' RNA ligase